MVTQYNMFLQALLVQYIELYMSPTGTRNLNLKKKHVLIGKKNRLFLKDIPD